MFTENLHLEQERTKFSYHDRHKLIVLFAPFFPRLARASNTTVLGLGGGRWRYRFCPPKEGAGSILARGCCVIT